MPGPTNDIVAIQIKGCPPHASIIDLFADSFELAEQATLLLPGRSIPSNPKALKPIGLKTSLEDGSKKAKIMTNCMISHYDPPTEHGFSGAPVLANRSMPFIIGLHSGGCEEVGVTSFITKSRLKALVKSIPGFRIHEARNERCRSVVDMTDDPPHHKSFLPAEGGFGSYEGHSIVRTHFKPSVMPTLISDLVTEELDIPPMHQPPGGIAQGSKKFWTRATVSQPAVDAEILALAVDDYKKQLVSEGIPKFSPVPLDVAVNGQDGVNFVDRLPMSTSGGAEHPGPKRQYFQQGVPNEYISDLLEPGPELLININEITYRLKRGQSVGVPFQGHPKDEPVSLTNPGEPAKQRIFCAAPQTLNIIARKFFLSVIKFLRESRVTESAVGVNMASASEVQAMYEQLLANVGFDMTLKRCGAGDFKGFDLTLPPEILHAIAEIMMFLIDSYTLDEKAIAQGCLSNIIWPTVLLDGDICVVAINPSGHMATTDFNCVGNSLLFRYAYFMAKRDYISSFRFTKVPQDTIDACFRDHVILLAYGDDNIYSISESCPFFDQCVVADKLAEIGMTYTSEDKISEVVPFRSFDQLSFLSRSVHIVDGKYRAILSDKSISKMLHFQKKSELSAYNRAWEGIKNALFEFYLRTPKEYSERKDQLRSVARQAGMISLWDDNEIDADFEERSK